MAKKATLESLAGMVQRGFEDLGSRMATKEDLKALATKEELNALKEELLEKLASKDDLKVFGALWVQELAKLQDEVATLRVRVEILEGKRHRKIA